MSMPAPRRSHRVPDAPGLKTRSENANKHPGNAPGVKGQPRRTPAQMEEARTVAAKEAEKAEAAQKAVLERVARIEDKQNADDDAYSENADHPPSSDYQALSSDYQEMDDSSEESLKLPDGESMDEADGNYLEDSDVDTDSDEDEGTQTDKRKYKKNPSKPTRQDIERLRSTKDSSGTPKSSAELDTSAAKKRKADLEGRTYGDGTNKEGFFLSYNILYTFAHHLNELDTIPAKYERSMARPVGALLLAVQAVERNLGFWKTGQYVVPKGSDWFFSCDNWSDIRQTDPKTGNTLITRRATKYLSTIEKWTAERWDQQLDEAAVWKERKRQKKLPCSAASSEVEEVIEIIDDDEDDVVVSD
ncbi:hypothetical protein DFH08DRAFT_929746 [Mycena albidolilacea]|uniref:Uncharacterized protein n=1 Tax=Mycena albidolilacea TaxID=1033008 RepID=A0AAD7AT69_9AGAR|nr:hypothetical protein DFH08DRAFT_929746 [Mycena albidolilacea]